MFKLIDEQRADKKNYFFLLNKTLFLVIFPRRKQVDHRGERPLERIGSVKASSIEKHE